MQRVLNKEKSNAHLMDDGSRSYVREITRVERMLVPGHCKMMVEDREVYMFTMLRRMAERLIVAVVGMELNYYGNVQRMTMLISFYSQHQKMGVCKLGMSQCIIRS